ncbi:MAG: hypothetical protein RXO22_07350 [Thermocladium sp.]|jgi:hypothetical protein|nr:MAG: hypothetical protein AT710_01715 [Thermocladium sp. ECH_B]
MSVIDRLNVLIESLKSIKSSCRDPDLIEDAINKALEIERDVSIMADSLIDIYTRSRYLVEKYIGKGSVLNIDQRITQQILDMIGTGSSLDKILEGKDEEESQMIIYILNAMKQAGLVDFNITLINGKIKININRSL